MRFLMDKLNKIVWFYSTHDTFDYFVTRGTTQSLNMDAQEIKILQHLMIKEAEKLGKKTDWLVDPSSFNRNLKWGLSWANEKNHALIFKYKPSESVKDAKYEFNKTLRNYKREPNDDTYNAMRNAFSDFFNLL